MVVFFKESSFIRNIDLTIYKWKNIMLGFLLKYCTSAHMQIHTKWGGDIRNKIGLEMLTVETGRWDPSVTPFSLFLCMLEIFHNKQ